MSYDVTPEFDLLIPFFSDWQRLDQSLRQIRTEKKRLNIKNVFLCHNGPALPAEIWTKLQNSLQIDEHLLHTEQLGVGAGYKLGISQAQSHFLILSASDLPFGFTDLEEFLKLTLKPALALGSKRQKGSVIGERPFIRRFITLLFYLCRLLILGFDTPKDSQGTMIIERSLARKILNHEICSNSFLFTLELSTCALRIEKIKVVELPVVYFDRGRDSSVNIYKHSFEMLMGLLRLRSKL